MEVALQDEQEWLLVRAVRLARAEGLNWAQIGRLLGVTRQSARERFERLAPRVGPTPPHIRGRSRWEAHVIEVRENSADVRRRREFESGDAVFW
jgi:hypothetical protein